MSTPKQSSTSRLLQFLKSKAKPSVKGNTIRETSLGGQTDAVTQAPALRSTNKDNDFPREYYKPRPTPKSFVISDVRKVSNIDSPPDSIKAQRHAASYDAGTNPKNTVETSHTVNAPEHTEDPTIPSLKSKSSEGSALARPATQTRTDPGLMLNGVHGKQRQRPTFDLLLGQQDPASPYLTRRYFSEPYVADTNDVFEPPRDILHHIPELDPHAFDIYKIYTQIGKIGFRCPSDVKADHIWIACWPLLNAHILGCIIEESAFADRVMDTLIERLAQSSAPDLETVQHLFDESGKNTPAALKLFVADRFINAQERSHSILEISKYPISFKEEVLRSALRRLAYGRSTRERPGCAYHVHGDRQACYKTSITLADTLKEQRLAAAREKSARDAEFVTTNALRNGVRSVDWEQHRANGNQALRVDTGQTWTRFSRIHNGEFGNECDRKKATSNHINGEIDCASHKMNGKSTVRPVNAFKPNHGMIKTPNNSPVLQSRSTKTHLINSKASVAPTNDGTLASEPAVSPIAAPNQSPTPFLLAELDGTSMDAPQRTALALKYRSSVDRKPAFGSRATSVSFSTNGVGEHETVFHRLSNGASESDHRVGKLTTEYERCVSCPGAYPESNVGV
jgi:hypothetical protein